VPRGDSALFTGRCRYLPGLDCSSFSLMTSLELNETAAAMGPLIQFMATPRHHSNIGNVSHTLKCAFNAFIEASHALVLVDGPHGIQHSVILHLGPGDLHRRDSGRACVLPPHSPVYSTEKTKHFVSLSINTGTMKQKHRNT